MKNFLKITSLALAITTLSAKAADSPVLANQLGGLLSNTKVDVNLVKGSFAGGKLQMACYEIARLEIETKTINEIYYQASKNGTPRVANSPEAVTLEESLAAERLASYARFLAIPCQRNELESSASDLARATNAMLIEVDSLNRAIDGN